MEQENSVCPCTTMRMRGEGVVEEVLRMESISSRGVRQ
jgi:hypothetical protein